MKKRIVCLTLALLMSATQVVSVSASREDELREEQAITSQQLDATYSRMDELAYAKSQLENEISELDSNLVSVMVSIDTLKGDIDNKEVDIIKTKQDLAKAQKARDKQYESMKLRIQALYEQGGDAAWFQMMLNSEDLSELLTRAENTQQMYEQDRKNLDKYDTCITFVSQASLDNGIKEKLGLQKKVVAVKGCRNIGKKDLKFNDATPELTVDPETYVVKADGVLLTCEVSKELPLTQLYYLF